METEDQLEKRMSKCSFILKTLLKKWDTLGDSAQETSTYGMVKEALNMLEGRFNDYISINTEIDDDTYLQLAKMAHEQDITFNQLVEQSLRLQAEKDLNEFGDNDDKNNDSED